MDVMHYLVNISILEPHQRLEFRDYFKHKIKKIEANNILLENINLDDEFFIESFNLQIEKL